jgi:hypothetical protein
MLRLCWDSRCGDLEVPAGPIWGWSAYGHGEVYTPLVSSHLLWRLGGPRRPYMGLVRL